MRKGAATERARKTRHAADVLMRIRPTPSCDGIGGECQNHCIDCWNLVG
jgi:hypothetical protein